MAETVAPGRTSGALRRILVPLALAQFICSFAGSNMNVMINDISEDLDTTVQGVQVAITIFLLVMAALMIPGGKLTDRYGRSGASRSASSCTASARCSARSPPASGVLIIGNSILEGVGTALLIPPVYILTTLLFTEIDLAGPRVRRDQRAGGHRRRGRAADRWADHLGHQLAGGLRLPGARHRGHRRAQPARRRPAAPRIRTAPSTPSARSCRPSGLVLLVMGILAADDNVWLMLGLIVAGALVLVVVLPARCGPRSAPARSRCCRTALFRNRTSNLGLVTQNTQWLVLMGVSFIVAAYLQVVRGYDAIQTGVIFTAATVGLLLSSLGAERFAKRRAQRTLIVAGFVVTIAGIAVFLAMVGIPRASGPSPLACSSSAWGSALMLTPSVNVVQSSFGEEQQGEISGLSRSVSNLGSSLGTAVAGTILVAGLTDTPARLRPGDGRPRRARAHRLVAAALLPRRAGVTAPAT